MNCTCEMRLTAPPANTTNEYDFIVVTNEESNVPDVALVADPEKAAVAVATPTLVPIRRVFSFQKKRRANKKVPTNACGDSCSNNNGDRCRNYDCGHRRGSLCGFQIESSVIGREDLARVKSNESNFRKRIVLVVE